MVYNTINEINRCLIHCSATAHFYRVPADLVLQILCYFSVFLCRGDDKFCVFHELKIQFCMALLKNKQRK